MGTIKERNGKDLTEVEKIKKRWQDYIELYKKDLNDLDNYDCVVTYMEPDILECEVKWPLGSVITNKANGGDEIPAEPLKILKDDAINVLHSMYQQIWKTQQWYKTGEGQFSFQSQRRTVPKNVQTTGQLSSFHGLVSLCSKSCMLGFNSMSTEDFQIYKLGCTS